MQPLTRNRLVEACPVQIVSIRFLAVSHFKTLVIDSILPQMLVAGIALAK